MPLNGVTRESVSWMLTTLIGLVTAFGGYHIYMNSIHEPVGATATALNAARAQSSAIILRMESQNQNLTNHYLENIEKGVMVEESQEQLTRLKYDRVGIKELKQNVLGFEAETED
jgi:hypothetical protein